MVPFPFNRGAVSFDCGNESIPPGQLNGTASSPGVDLTDLFAARGEGYMHVWHET